MRWAVGAASCRSPEEADKWFPLAPVGNNTGKSLLMSPLKSTTMKLFINPILFLCYTWIPKSLGCWGEIFGSHLSSSKSVMSAFDQTGNGHHNHNKYKGIHACVHNKLLCRLDRWKTVAYFIYSSSKTMEVFQLTICWQWLLAVLGATLRCLIVN